MEANRCSTNLIDMSVRCSWCVSPARHAAEEAIADGIEVSEVARSYKLSRDQWYKHRHHGTLVKQGTSSLAAVRLEVIEGGGGPYTVIPRLEDLLLKADVLREKWASKPSVVVALLRLERDILGDIAKLRGEFPHRPQMSLDQLPQWGTILYVLDRHPDARSDILKALDDGE
jgi:hypothetical protein